MVVKDRRSDQKPNGAISVSDDECSTTSLVFHCSSAAFPGGCPGRGASEEEATVYRPVAINISFFTNEIKGPPF